MWLNLQLQKKIVMKLRNRLEEIKEDRAYLQDFDDDDKGYKNPTKWRETVEKNGVSKAIICEDGWAKDGIWKDEKHKGNYKKEGEDSAWDGENE